MNKKIIVILLLCSLVFIPFKVEAKTLAGLREELEQLKQKKADQEAKKDLTESEMNNVNSRIASISTEITTTESTIKTLGDEIEELNEQAKQRELEIKEIMHFLQIANGESAYLEYIFGAKDITDFVYRSAISGQLVDYNEKLIKEYNDTIKKNEEKQVELKGVLVTLDKQQEELNKTLASLGSELNKMTDVSLTIDEEIKAATNNINTYKQTFDRLGCKETEEIDSCLSKDKSGNGVVPYYGGFIRPLTSGRITSSYGWRCYTLHGKRTCGTHNGIDIAGGGTKVYAAAPGKVGQILWQQSCGGNEIFVHHNIGGVKYTTAYFHVKNIKVKVGQIVDQNTILADMGGTPDTWWYDGCSTGGHLHFAVAKGHYFKDYSYYSEYIAKNVNPTSVVNFPSGGGWFSNRITKY